MTTSKNVLVTIENGIATITLNRPEQANGLNLETGQELYDICCEVEDEAVRVVILTAKGNYFSVGGDLTFMIAHKKNPSVAVKKLADTFHKVLLRLIRMQKPVIVGVNGMAAGGGFSMAMTGDIVIAKASAKFNLAYTASGLSPDGGSSYFLPRLIGLRKTAQLMLTNQTLSAKEALEWGLLTQAVPDDEFETTLHQMAQKLAKGPTPAFSSVKQLLLASYHNDLETQMDMESQLIAKNLASPHGLEGLNAFLEKRKPNFLNSSLS